MLTRLIADYFAMSAYIKSLCCIPEANTVSYFDYISIKKKKNSTCRRGSVPSWRGCGSGNQNSGSPSGLSGKQGKAPEKGDGLTKGQADSQARVVLVLKA